MNGETKGKCQDFLNMLDGLAVLMPELRLRFWCLDSLGFEVDQRTSLRRPQLSVPSQDRNPIIAYECAFGVCSALGMLL